MLHDSVPPHVIFRSTLYINSVPKFVRKQRYVNVNAIVYSNQSVTQVVISGLPSFLSPVDLKLAFPPNSGVVAAQMLAGRIGKIFFESLEALRRFLTSIDEALETLAEGIRHQHGALLDPKHLFSRLSLSPGQSALYPGRFYTRGNGSTYLVARD